MSDQKYGGAKADEGAKDEVKVQQPAAQDELGRLNPSAPGQTGTTPGSNKPKSGE